MKFLKFLYQLPLRIRARAKARNVAIDACHGAFPDELIHGAWVCADEPDRYVVRVFCGGRQFVIGEARMLPPWQTCLIFAVTKNTYAVQRLPSGGRYDPVLR